MKKLTFVSGGNIRRVFIDKRKVTFIVPETGFAPIEIDLDRLGEVRDELVRRMGKEAVKHLKALAKLKTEEDMIKDITKDFQRTGWRRVRNDDVN